jgi:site-specific DNA-methyltransferase (adenine-specific)
MYILKRWSPDPSKGEVFTPIELVSEIIDEIPSNVWLNPKSLFLDPCMGKGTFLIEIVRRLVDIYGYGELDAKSRVFGYDIRVKYINYLRRRGYVNVQHKDFLNEKIEMKFDVSLGNPPYQMNDGGGTGSSAVPIYHKFLYKSLEISDKVFLITPSRWFKGGKGLDKFREDMLNRTDIKFIKHYENEKDCFDIELPGGVSYLYIDKNYSGVTKFIDNKTNTEIDIKLNNRDILVTDVISNHIIDKVINRGLGNFGDLVLSRNPFNISSNHSDWVGDGIKCYTKDGDKYVIEDKINDKFNILKKYKLLISKADGAAYKLKRVISKYKISEPNTVSTETYLICYTSENEKECINVGNYLMTKFSRFMLLLRMSGQNNSKDKFKWVPIMDFTKEWTNQELYDYFNLTEEEIKHIENNVK